MKPDASNRVSCDEMFLLDVFIVFVDNEDEGINTLVGVEIA